MPLSFGSMPSTTPDSAGHEAGDEHDDHYERHLDVIDDVDGPRARRVRPEPATTSHAPADERDHRPDLEQYDAPEERQLDPEEVRREVELCSLLEASERAQQTGSEPEERRHAPHGVGREETS